MDTYKGYHNSVIGWLEIVCNNDYLLEINFVSEKKEENTNAIVKKTIVQLDEYFAGVRKIFDIPLQVKGTKFQEQVWNALLTIPYGKTASYKDIAVAIKNDKAVRAVGSANGKNKIPIVIPCHRIINLNGKLGGYAGELWRKEKLLEIENAKVK